MPRRGIFGLGFGLGEGGLIDLFFGRLSQQPDTRAEHMERTIRMLEEENQRLRAALLEIQLMISQLSVLRTSQGSKTVAVYSDQTFQEKKGELKRKLITEGWTEEEAEEFIGRV